MTSQTGSCHSLKWGIWHLSDDIPTDDPAHSSRPRTDTTVKWTTRKSSSSHRAASVFLSFPRVWIHSSNDGSAWKGHNRYHPHLQLLWNINDVLTFLLWMLQIISKQGQRSFVVCSAFRSPSPRALCKHACCQCLPKNGKVSLLVKRCTLDFMREIVLTFERGHSLPSSVWHVNIYCQRELRLSSCTNTHSRRQTVFHRRSIGFEVR